MLKNIDYETVKPVLLTIGTILIILCLVMFHMNYDNILLMGGLVSGTVLMIVGISEKPEIIEQTIE